MTKRLAACGAAFVLLASLFLFQPVRAVATTTYTSLLSVWIRNSLIDGTPIGSSIPSTGAFTTASASSGFTGNLTGNVTGNVTGNLTGKVTANTGGVCGLVSLVGSASFPCYGSYIGWGLGGGGEVDYIDSPGSSASGHNWYGTGSTSSVGTLMMNLDSSSNLHVTGSISSGTGTFTGNAATATQFAADPSDCTSPSYARGINSHGVANCAQPSIGEISGTPALTATSGYQAFVGGMSMAWGTGSSVSSDSVQTVSLPTTFAHGCITAWSVNLDPSQSTNITKNWAIVSCNVNSVAVELQRRGDEGSFSAQPRVFAIGY